MVFILLRSSMLLNFCLKLNSLLARLLTLQLNLMHIWLPQGGHHCLTPFLQMIGWQPSLSLYHSSRHFICYLLGEPVFVCSMIDSLCCCFVHSSILEGHSLLWPFLLYLISSCSLCILWCRFTSPPLVIVFFLILLWFLSETRNKPLWPAPI